MTNGGKIRDMKTPKPRRKSYRYFQNFDVVQHEGEWFIRFPNEREHIHFGDKRYRIFEAEVMKEIERIKREREYMYVDALDYGNNILETP